MIWIWYISPHYSKPPMQAEREEAAHAQMKWFLSITFKLSFSFKERMSK
jgi:hypothetical protein